MQSVKTVGIAKLHPESLALTKSEFRLVKTDLVALRAAPLTVLLFELPLISEIRMSASHCRVR